MSNHAWTEPGAFAVGRGVWRIPLPLPTDGLRAVNVYAIEADDGLVLVDSGWALDIAKDALAGALATIGRDFGDIRRFLVTHVHRDHYTLAITLRRMFGSKVALGIGEQPSLNRIRSGRMDGQARSMVRWGAQSLVARWAEEFGARGGVAGGLGLRGAGRVARWRHLARRRRPHPARRAHPGTHPGARGVRRRAGRRAVRRRPRAAAHHPVDRV
ncbi:hypothetical protein GCM10027436_64010 [Actinophytocola sediminis]